MRLAFSLFFFLTFALLASNAEAQDASTLLNEARVQRAQGDHRRALGLARRAGEIDMTASVRLFIAEELRALGELSSALRNAQWCVDEFEGAPPTQQSGNGMRDECQRLAETLRGLVGTLTIRVEDHAPEGLRVRVGDQAISSSMFGLPQPFDPGHHEVLALIDGREVFRRSVDLGAGDRLSVTLVLPALQSSNERVPIVRSFEEVEVAQRRLRIRAERNANAVPVGPIVLSVLGVSGIIAGALLLGGYFSAGDGCTRGAPQLILCENSQALVRAQTAPTWLTTSVLSFSLGAAFSLSGLLWLGLERSISSSRNLSVHFVGTPAGAGLAGMW